MTNAILIALDIALLKSAILKESLIEMVHISIRYLGPIPTYLFNTSAFFSRKLDTRIITKAKEILDTEISSINDIKGTSKYKQFLVR